VEDTRILREKAQSDYKKMQENLGKIQKIWDGRSDSRRSEGR
jgi:hypothetical protein